MTNLNIKILELRDLVSELENRLRQAKGELSRLEGQNNSYNTKPIIIPTSNGGITLERPIPRNLRK